MQNPAIVLNNLTKQSQNPNFTFNRLYRNFYNVDFYLQAYSKIYAKEGNMTPGIDGNTIDGMSIRKIENIIELIKTEEFQPKPVKRVYIPKKNGKKRPLGVPSFEDKLVQEVIRMILEAIYEPSFQDTSHGFRPERSCHTALKRVQKTFTGVKWFVEGDIEGFFDNIDHHTLINIIRRKIKDEKFIRLIWKFLRAGYLEKWVYHKTYSGTPQGGIISPILSNIYLNELDTFMKEFKDKFDEGVSRKRNPEYKRIESKLYKRRKKLGDKKNSMSVTERKALINEIKDLKKMLVQTPYSEPMDVKFKRIQYVRYADDFLIGIIGNKKDAENLKTELTEFLSSNMKLKLSQEKTLITHAKDKAKFLGYEITTPRTEQITSDGRKSIGRIGNGNIKLYVPKENWLKKLQELKVLEICQDGSWKPKHRAFLANLDDLEIISLYNAEIRGLYNYYKLANNVSVLHDFSYIMEYSMYKTFGSKYKMSVKKIRRKFNVNGQFGIQYKNKKGESKTRLFYKEGFTKVRNETKTVIDSLPKTIIYTNPRTGLLQRLNANQCEYCGKTEMIEVHHVKKLKDLKGKKHWEKVMIARKRKTMMLCISCHDDLHSGRLD